MNTSQSGRHRVDGDEEARLEWIDRLVGHAKPRQSAQPLEQAPDWLRVSEAVKRYALSRSLIYELIKTGAIKSVCLRKRHNVRGVRLISRASFDEFLENLFRDQVQEGQFLDTSSTINP